MADGIVDKAIGSISAADLTPIEHQILINFVKESGDPNLAAQEVLDRICDDSQSVEDSLRNLKKDWHNLIAGSGYL